MLEWFWQVKKCWNVIPLILETWKYHFWMSPTPMFWQYHTTMAQKNSSADLNVIPPIWQLQSGSGLRCPDNCGVVLMCAWFGLVLPVPPEPLSESWISCNEKEKHISRWALLLTGKQLGHRSCMLFGCTEDINCIDDENHKKELNGDRTNVLQDRATVQEDEWR